ncbi:MAG: nucleotidyltransferase family protein [Myxococcales bacterium]
MNRDQILAILRPHGAELATLGVRSLARFGSGAQGTASAKSDVHLLVEFDRPIGLLEFVGAQQRLGDIVGHPVDLVPRDYLKPSLRSAILSEAITVAEVRYGR